MGGTPARSRQGVPWGIPTGMGYPGQVLTGVPLPTRDGVPRPGPDGGTPPCQGWGTLAWYRTTDGVLDTPQSVCLLHSHRWTFLLKKKTDCRKKSISSITGKITLIFKVFKAHKGSYLKKNYFPSFSKRLCKKKGHIFSLLVFDSTYNCIFWPHSLYPQELRMKTILHRLALNFQTIDSFPLFSKPHIYLNHFLHLLSLFHLTLWLNRLFTIPFRYVTSNNKSGTSPFNTFGDRIQ